jgi:hypothetical protein
MSPQAPPGCSGQGVVSAAQGVPSLRGGATEGGAGVVAPGHDGAGWVGGGISLRKKSDHLATYVFDQYLVPMQLLYQPKKVKFP